MMSFTAASILPATRDVNAVFYADWDKQTDYLGSAYVCGVGGWYDNKAGIERNVVRGEGTCFRTVTNSYTYPAGKEIRMTCGAINGHIFMVVDDELVTEYSEYVTPLTVGHFGFSPYCTRLKIKDIDIYEIYYDSVKEGYDPEF